MEGGKTDVTAFQLAAELASRTLTCASAAPPSAPAAAADDEPSGAKKDSSNVKQAKRRGPRSQVQRLLDDQRGFALRDGMPYNHTGTSSTPTQPTTTAETSSLLTQRLPQDMYGHDTSSISPVKRGCAVHTYATSASAALQETVLRWGRMKSGQGDNAVDGDDRDYAKRSGHGESGSSSPLLRHTWHLVEAQRRSTSSCGYAQHTVTATPIVRDRWSLGQRWQRSDEMVQDNALLQALQRGMPQRHESAADGHSATDAYDSFYQCGLQLCAERVEGAASLPARLCAAPLSRSPPLTFFTFTEMEYNALSQPPPPPLPPSTFTFTYASCCYLFELWSLFGNPVVVVDRWAWDVKREEPLPPLTTSLQKSSIPSLNTTKTAPSTKDAEESGEHVNRCVPSVEQACAEYHRVTAGVLQRRQQRLLSVVLAQQQQQQQQQQQKGSNTRVSPTAAAASSTNNASATTHAPFVASFGRYALLHAARDDGDGEKNHGQNDVVDFASPPKQEQQLLPSQLSPPPLDPRTVASSSASVTNVVKAEGSANYPSSSASPLPALQESTPQQRLIACTTPHPWYTYPAELRRRADVAELLRCEGAANVPYQKAATAYFALAISAAHALQRASFVFDDRDRASVATEGRTTRHAQMCGDARGAESGDPSVSGTSPPPPPREAFTVQLQPLTGVDPAAWRAAEAVLRKAAMEVLGTGAARWLSGAQRRPRPGRHGKRPRGSVSAAGGGRGDASRVASKGLKRRNRDSATAAAATRTRSSSSTAKKSDKNLLLKKDAQDGDGDEASSGLRRGSSESSLTSNSTTGDPAEDDGADGEESDANDEDAVGEDATAHSWPLRDEMGDGIEEERAANAEWASQRQPRREDRLAKRLPNRSGSPLSMLPSSHLYADPTYRTLQEYITDVIPFRCTRCRIAAQAGWLLPTPPALPHSLTNPLDEGEVVLVDVHAALSRQSRRLPEPARGGAVVGDDAGDGSDAHNSTTTAAGDAEPTSGSSAIPGDPYRPILTEHEYQELCKVSTSAVCNRVVSHTGEAVLLSLPAALPRMHREVEQELERYLYDDTSALMEVDATAQSLLAEIRVAYTQGIYLQRYTARLEHVVENLKKVVQDCEEEEKVVGGTGADDPTTSL